MKTKPNLFRLKRLLRHMKSKNRIHEVFDFSCFNDGWIRDTIIPNCKTHGCLAGELPGIWRSWYFTKDGLFNKQYDARLIKRYKTDLTQTTTTTASNVPYALKSWFNLTPDQITVLFYPYYHRYNPLYRVDEAITVDKITQLLPDATLKEVLNNLKAFIKFHEKRNTN